MSEGAGEEGAELHFSSALVCADWEQTSLLASGRKVSRKAGRTKKVEQIQENKP
jgi:hypothetical protein